MAGDTAPTLESSAPCGRQDLEVTSRTERLADGLYLDALWYEGHPRWEGDGGLQYLHEAPQLAAAAGLARDERGAYEEMLAKLVDRTLGDFPRAAVARWDRAVRARGGPLATRAAPEALAGVVARLAAREVLEPVQGRTWDPCASAFADVFHHACVFCGAVRWPAWARRKHRTDCLWRAARAFVHPEET